MQFVISERLAIQIPKTFVTSRKSLEAFWDLRVISGINSIVGHLWKNSDGCLQPFGIFVFFLEIFVVICKWRFWPEFSSTFVSKFKFQIVEYVFMWLIQMDICILKSNFHCPSIFPLYCMICFRLYSMKTECLKIILIAARQFKNLLQNNFAFVLFHGRQTCGLIYVLLRKLATKTKNFDKMSRDNLNSCKVIYFIVVQWISLLYGPFKSRYALKQPTQTESCITSSIPR